jgi:peptide/nickel transport system ATP-binding protein/oligopeptide transport system ATP-binding protein
MSALLAARGLRKTFANGVRAVDGIDLDLAEGETLGLVGESGCGKSTTGRIVLRLTEPDAGDLRFEGSDLLGVRGRKLRRLRARLQVVPQDPRTSLNPRLSSGEAVAFNLRAHGWRQPKRRQRVLELFAQVGLAATYVGRYPHELSGGQAQRVAIARALATEPRLVVCDEPVSALDKSVQAEVLNLLATVQAESGVSYLFISHDLSVVEHIADRIAVMYLGRVVERGPASRVMARPLHPYTQALFASVPGPKRVQVRFDGEPPSPRNPPSGCHFRTRCPQVTARCAEAAPPLLEVEPGHLAACVHYQAASNPESKELP